jgi:integrase
VRLHRHYLGLLARQVLDPWDATLDDLLEFLAVERWEPETRRSARSVCRGFYRWAHGRGYLDDDPSTELPGVKVPDRAPQPVPETIVVDLANSDDLRIAFMAMLAAIACLRVGEIARVHGDDLVDGALWVKGKGGKIRRVPIEDPVLLAMLQAVGSQWAFRSSKPGRQHLTPGHVSKLLSRALPGHWTGHKLRHRGATVALDATDNLLAVMEFLGHSRPETTIRYTLGSKAKLRACATATAIHRPSELEPERHTFAEADRPTAA